MRKKIKIVNWNILVAIKKIKRECVSSGERKCIEQDEEIIKNNNGKY